MKFDEAFMEVVGSEGCFSDDRRDPGNWTCGVVGKGELKGTKFGISAASYPYLDICNLTLEDAKEIYLRDYWDIWRPLDGLPGGMPDSLLFELFDASVNTGRGNAIRFLQKTVDVAPDGRVGEVTISALDTALRDNGIARVEQWFLAEKLDHYTRLTTWETFGKGWARRVAKSLRNI